MSEYERLSDVQDQLEGVGESAASTGDMLVAFDGELKRVRQSLQMAGGDLHTFERGMSKGLKRAVDGLVQDGDSLSDALRNVFKSVMQTAYDAAVTPVTDHFGAMIARGVSGMMPFADGAAFSQGRVMPFANGGIVSQATAFPMRGGVGVMGEAGPEAIMPLARGADGKLGVRGGAGRPVQVVMHIQTSDVEGFRRSQGQIAAQMSRAILRGQRNL